MMSCEILSATLDMHPDVICRCDLAFNITYANKAAKAYFASGNCLSTGKATDALASYEPLVRLSDELSLLTPVVSTMTSTHHVDASDGGSCWMLWTHVSLCDADEKLVGYQSMGRDITRQVDLRAIAEGRQNEILKTRAELRHVIDSVPAMIWYKDDKNKILHLNKSAADSMGMTVETAEGENTYDIFGDAAKSYHDDDLKVINSGAPLLGIVERFTPNGEDPRWVRTDKIPFDETGAEGKRILVVSTDITELKTQEAMLSSINKNLDDFASLTSHDLQAPLRKIGLASEFLEIELGENVSEEGRVLLSDISDGVRHMTTLIQSFLKFMRTTPEKVTLEPINLRDILVMAKTRLHSDLEGVSGEIDLPDQDIYMNGEAALLGQVFGNLFSNSIKYRSHDRDLRVVVSAKLHSKMWTITVTDNGIGIDKAQTKSVFELFGRAKPHLGVKGDGIGLALCKRIVTLHSGAIDLIEVEHVGSCFRLIFNESGRGNG